MGCSACHQDKSTKTRFRDANAFVSCFVPLLSLTARKSDCGCLRGCYRPPSNEENKKKRVSTESPVVWRRKWRPFWTYPLFDDEKKGHKTSHNRINTTFDYFGHSTPASHGSLVTSPHGLLILRSRSKYHRGDNRTANQAKVQLNLPDDITRPSRALIEGNAFCCCVGPMRPDAIKLRSAVAAYTNKHKRTPTQTKLPGKQYLPPGSNHRFHTRSNRGPRKGVEIKHRYDTSHRLKYTNDFHKANTPSLSLTA